MSAYRLKRLLSHRCWLSLLVVGLGSTVMANVFNMGLGLSVTGYNQQLYFTLMVDPNAVPDVERLKECLDESFLELRRAAGVEAFDLPEFRGRAAGNGGTAVTQEAMVEE